MKILYAFIFSLFVFGIVIADDSKNELTQVIAAGTGTTETKALQEAFRNAVQQAVGVMIDAKTQVENDEVIEEILTHSQGFIKEHKILSTTKNDDGLIRLTILATVEKRSLSQRFESTTVVSQGFDGAKIGGNLLLQLEARDNAAKILQNAMKGFPLNCMTVDEPVVTVGGMDDIKDGKVPVKIVFKVSADLKAYQNFSERLCKTLDGIKSDVSEHDVKAVRVSASSMKSQSLGNVFPLSVPGQFSYVTGLTVTVNTQISDDFNDTSWRVYSVDQSCLPLLAIMACTSFGIKLEMNDKDGKPVVVRTMSTTSLPHWDTRGATLSSLSGVSVRPQMAENRGMSFTAPLMPTFVAMKDCLWVSHSNLWESDQGARINDASLQAYFTIVAGNEGIRGRGYIPSKSLHNVFIGPAFLSNFCYTPDKTYTIDLALTLEELKEINDVKALLYFDGDFIPENPEKYLRENFPAHLRNRLPQWLQERFTNAQ